MSKPIIKVSVKCSGQGTTYYETIELTKDDIEKLAEDKARENDSSENINAVDVEFCLNV